MSQIETGEELILESKAVNDGFVSSYEAYHQCRYRDLCLRYMGENPKDWIDIHTTPCPCSPEFWRNLMIFSRVLDAERTYGVFPFTHKEIITRIVDNSKRVTLRKHKQRHIPLSQAKLIL